MSRTGAARRADRSEFHVRPRASHPNRSDLRCAEKIRCRAAARFGVVAIEAPLSLGRFRMKTVAQKVAMMDAGLTWLVGLLPAAGPKSTRPRAVLRRVPR
jgi:hypothetical protein